MTRYQLAIISISLTLTISSCGRAQEASRCSDLSKRAHESLSKYLYDDRDTVNLIASLTLYDSAIACDSLNVINYHNKITTLGLLKRRKEMLKVQDRLFLLSKKKDAMILISKGLIYERLGLSDSSKIEFNKARMIYDEELRQNSSDSIKLICERIYLMAILHGKDRALQEFEPYLKKYPTDLTIQTYELTLRDFDKEVILQQY